jgi:phosphoribosyl-AMP cyclohydrolase
LSDKNEFNQNTTFFSSKEDEYFCLGEDSGDSTDLSDQNEFNQNTTFFSSKEDEYFCLGEDSGET